MRIWAKKVAAEEGTGVGWVGGRVGGPLVAMVTGKSAAQDDRIAGGGLILLGRPRRRLTLLSFVASLARVIIILGSGAWWLAWCPEDGLGAFCWCMGRESLHMY